MAHLSPYPKFRAFDTNGLPLVGGQLFSYQAGTSTPQATFTDESGAAPNTNPVILDAYGEANVWLDDAKTYKLVLQDADGETLWTVDNIASINDFSVTLDKLQDGILANSTDGRKKMEDGYLSATADGLAKMEDGFLSNDADGRAKMADGFLSADNVGRAKMAGKYVTREKLQAPPLSDLRMVEFLANDTWTVPADITRILVEGWGGGGGGAPGGIYSGAGTNVGGGGGAAGTYALVLIDNITPGLLLTILIGAGGTPGTPGVYSRVARPGLPLVTFPGGNPGNGKPGGIAYFPSGRGGGGGAELTGGDQGGDSPCGIGGLGGFSFPVVAGNGGGGGGGGGGFGNGAPGGAGGNESSSTAPAAGGAAAANSGAGGGGGGGARISVPSMAGAGGAGGSGRIRIYY